MALETFNTFQMSTDELNKLVQLINRFSLQFKNYSIIDGIMVTTDVAIGSNSVVHGLGKIPVGFLVIAKSANEDIWGNVFTKENLTIESSGTATLKLWVF